MSDPHKRRFSIATSLVVTAVLGAGVATAARFATGAVHAGSSTTTVIERGGRVVPASSRSSSGLSASSVYAGAASGVVDITASGVSAGSSGGGSPFGPFGGPSQPQRTTAAGTGFVIDAQGRILTAAHVVDSASSIKVSFQDGRSTTAKLLGEDKSTDVALLQVSTAGLSLHPLPLGSSNALVVGAPVAAIGDPFGYERSLSAGVVSGLDRSIKAPDGFTISHAIQTDAALNPGNSGGPVLNANGEVIGIADQIATGGGSGGGSAANAGVGFAVPINVARSVLPSLEHGGQVHHAYLGVASAPATGAAGGALVRSVQRGSPAAAAGLRAGDVIVRIDGRTISSVNDVIDVIGAHRPGDTIRLTVQRGSGQSTLSATLAQQPTSAPTG